MHNRDKTHCKNGHELIPENCKKLKKPGQRICLICHRARNAQYRSLVPKKPKKTAEDRFWSYVKKTKTCWLWTGCLSGGNTTVDPKPKYGVFGINWKQIYAHRFSYELYKGKILDDMQIDHLCKNTKCVNPDHLEAVTAKENTLRSSAGSAINAKKTHCIRGHPFTPQNTYIQDLGHRIKRACVQCRSMHNENLKVRQRAATQLNRRSRQT
jgi:hypothetical protein